MHAVVSERLTEEKSNSIQTLMVVFGLLEGISALCPLHAVPDPIHHGDPRVFLKPASVAFKKIPVHAVEGAGHLTVALLPIIFA